MCSPRSSSVLRFAFLVLLLSGSPLASPEKPSPSHQTDPPVVLRPGEERFAQWTSLGASGVRSYALCGLLGGSKYELRISYPASTPAEFKVTIHDPNEPSPSPSLTQTPPTHTGHRELLNTHIRHFYHRSLPHETPQCTLATVHLHPRDHPAHTLVPIPSRLSSLPQDGRVAFNIALDRMILGILPARAVPLVVLLTALVTTGLGWVGLRLRGP